MTASTKNRESISILMADDDADDRELTLRAFEENRLTNPLTFVKDGEELMDYLYKREAYKDDPNWTRPGIILLDLNMPRKDGREALKEIKSDPNLKDIPIIVLTTSRGEQDIIRSYNLGVNSFITKPVEFDSFVDMIRILKKYWIEIVALPPRD